MSDKLTPSEGGFDWKQKDTGKHLYHTEVESGAETDHEQPLAVAFVVVSQLFLTSHAYMKDSSIRIRASTLTSRFHSRSANGSNIARTARTALQSALRQAQIQPGDLQVVEVSQGVKKQMREILGDAHFAQPQEPWSSSDALSATTGWRDLCRLGQLAHYT